jgi:hypothetical protein
MDDYPYATLRADEWLRCDGLHHPSFPALLRDVLHHFGHTGTPMYHGHPYCEFGRGRCEVHVDIPAHPSDPGMTAWFTMATGDDLDDTLERVAPQTLMEFCEHHLPGLIGTSLPCSPSKMRATQCGGSAWLSWATPSVRLTTWGGCL